MFGHIRRYLLNCPADEDVFLFVPYIKTRVFKDLISGIQSRIIIVTTWEPEDIQFGSSDLDLYPFCKKHGISMYVSDKVHLKIYSIGLTSAILATGNVSHGGLLGGNHEAGTMLECLDIEDRLFLERIRNGARLADDFMYRDVELWCSNNRSEPRKPITLNDILSDPVADFLTSALPMTRSVNDLVAGYARLSCGLEPSSDGETTACILHDLANYGIDAGLAEGEFERVLTSRFFNHPFIRRIDGFIDPEAYFGRIKEWIQHNCTDVPVPSKRELTGNVQVLLEWFVALGDGRYVVDIPGTRSQRIRKI